MIILGSLKSAYSWLPISVNCTFFSLGVTTKALRAISLQRGLVDPQFQVEGVAPTAHSFFSENKAKWSFVWYKNLDWFFFRFVTIHAFDRRRDRQTDRLFIARRRPYSMQRGNKRHGIFTAMRPHATIRNLLVHQKDKVPRKTQLSAFTGFHVKTATMSTL